jgi:hypothetical protein
LRQIVKEHPPICGGAILRSQARADARADFVEPECKRPGSFRNPSLCVQSVEGARLSESLSRIKQTLIPIAPLKRQLERRVKGGEARA